MDAENSKAPPHQSAMAEQNLAEHGNSMAEQKPNTSIPHSKETNMENMNGKTEPSHKEVGGTSSKSNASGKAGYTNTVSQ